MEKRIKINKYVLVLIPITLLVIGYNFYQKKEIKMLNMKILTLVSINSILY